MSELMNLREMLRVMSAENGAYESLVYCLL